VTLGALCAVLLLAGGCGSDGMPEGPVATGGALARAIEREGEQLCGRCAGTFGFATETECLRTYGYLDVPQCVRDVARAHADELEPLLACELETTQRLADCSAALTCEDQLEPTDCDERYDTDHEACVAAYEGSEGSLAAFESCFTAG